MFNYRYFIIFLYIFINKSKNYRKKCGIFGKVWNNEKIEKNMKKVPFFASPLETHEMPKTLKSRPENSVFFWKISKIALF